MGNLGPADSLLVCPYLYCNVRMLFVTKPDLKFDTSYQSTSAWDYLEAAMGATSSPRGPREGELRDKARLTTAPLMLGKAKEVTRSLQRQLCPVTVLI